MNRRDFLKTSTLTAATLAVSPLQADAAKDSDKPTVKRYKEIGKTGIKMSDISFGSTKLNSSSMILRAIDRGINYFDTAPDYGPAEDHIGEAMPKIKRDKIYLTSKMCRPVKGGHLPFGSKKKDCIEVVNNSLSRLKTDYLDICFVHAIGSMSKDKDEEMKRLFDEEMFSAAEELKKAGKIRFLGATSHGPDNMESLMTEAVKSGRFDVVMMAFNFMKFPKVPDVIKEAKKRGVGVVAMKTLAGAKDTNFDAKGETFEPAVFKWVLKHPEVDGLVITFNTVSDFDLFLSASGKEFTASDQKILDRYAEMYGKEYCRTGCSDCEKFCAKGVNIANIMRYQMYFKDYGMEKRGIESYARLKVNAKVCIDCNDNSCAGGCPYGLPVNELLRKAHKDLSINV